MKDIQWKLVKLSKQKVVGYIDDPKSMLEDYTPDMVWDCFSHWIRGRNGRDFGDGNENYGLIENIIEIEFKVEIVLQLTANLNDEYGVEGVTTVVRAVDAKLIDTAPPSKNKILCKKQWTHNGDGNPIFNWNFIGYMGCVYK